MHETSGPYHSTSGQRPADSAEVAGDDLPVFGEGGRPDLPPSTPLQQPESSTPAPRTRAVTPWLLAVLLLLIVLLLTRTVVEDVSYAIARGQQRAARESLAELPLTNFAEASRLVAQSVGNSVVYVSTTQNVAQGRGRADEWSYFFGSPQAPREAQGQGSGVILSEDGYIVTNFHVVASSSEVRVHLTSGEIRKAQLVGADPGTDLALLKITPVRKLAVIPWGNSEALETGDPVWAVGSPYGLDNSVTFGIVSAKGRRGVGRARYQNFLQTDAAVNPGNSGGALVNSRGELIGINTAIIGSSYQGISFSIPSNLARTVVDKLKKDGKYDRGWLGVQLQPIDDALAKKLGMDEARGVGVVRIVAESPAAKGDVRSVDVILIFDGEAIDEPTHLSLMVAETPPGSTVDLVVFRDGEEITLSIEIGTLPFELVR